MLRWAIIAGGIFLFASQAEASCFASDIACRLNEMEKDVQAMQIAIETCERSGAHYDNMFDRMLNLFDILEERVTAMEAKLIVLRSRK
mgnify:CR=1 FL=1